VARKVEIAAAEIPEAMRAPKADVRRAAVDRATNGISGRATEPSGSRATVFDLNRALIKSRLECKNAQSQIERLAKRNGQLEQQLVELAQREAQVRRLAYHDELTGLPNRTMLQDRLSQAMSQANRQQKLVAVLLLDLDGFKSVNDRLGHAAGDRLLRAVAGRVAASIRGADTVCRHGGDEFVVMLPEIDTPARASAVAAKLVEYLAEPHVIDGYEIRITASIGTALYPSEGESYEDLLRCADINLYHAKLTRGHASIQPVAKETFAPGGMQLDLRPRWEEGGLDRDITLERESTARSE
jgi:diguanylate cyclase (GGDEF)-like protein